MGLTEEFHLASLVHMLSEFLYNEHLGCLQNVILIPFSKIH